MTGTIKRIKAENKYGFIRGEDGLEYFFHESGLKNATFDDLQEGQEVTFEDVDGSKGLRAEDIYV